MRRALTLLLGACLALLLSLPAGQARPARAAPPALPVDRLHFGLSNFDATWMTSSGVPWRYRFQYLAGGVNTGGGWTTWNSPPGAFATRYMDASTAPPANYISVFTYYMLLQSNPSSGATESDRDFSNLNNASTMQAYYGDFKLLMQTIGAFKGGSVVVHVEPDLWGYLQQRAQSQGASTADALSAAVASSGFSEATGFADTTQGFARLLVHLRDAYAPNAVLAVHASMWSSGIDIASNTDPNLDARAEADKTATFLNSTAGWDLVFNDVDDHNAAWWELASCATPPCVNQWFTHWWDPQNVRFPNFARYLLWVSELHLRTGRQQVAWQVPMGNQYYLTMNNTCGHYQDNVAPYFIAHAADLFSAGLIAVMFGAGNSCQTTNDDSLKDGVTNNGGAPTTDSLGGCAACNTNSSTVADDDGGYLRNFVGAYYASTVSYSLHYVFTWFDLLSDPAFQVDNIHVVNPSAGATVNVRVDIPGCGSQFGAISPAQKELIFSCPHGFGGPVVVNSDLPVIASQRVRYAASFNEVYAVPVTAAATTLYFQWYDLRSDPAFLADNVHVVAPTGANVRVSIPGCGVQAASLGTFQERYFSCAGGFGGPVVVSADQPVIASQRVEYGQTFNEIVGLPTSSAAAEIYLSWFDKASDPGFVSDNIHVIAPTGAAVQVAIPGCAVQTASLAAGQETYFSCPAGFGGPVMVTADQAVLASQRVKYFGSFNEVAGQPLAAAATTSYLTWYDRLSDPGFRADNVHVIAPTAANVRVSIPGCGVQSAAIAARHESYFTCAGGFGGPVTVTGDSPLIVSARVMYQQSFNEVYAGT